ncbi:MAG: SPASM domain-containing protein, partial [Bacteriovorax sp.]|nr:SPASM domain-containing protein [Bacteriovorax sp.]
MSVFYRQGMSRSYKEFNFLFSDLDIGIIAPIEKVGKIKNKFYRFKKIFFFVGELEIYTSEEMASLNKIFKSTGDLYFKIREFRQYNWLRDRMTKITGNKRGYYHRVKDWRKLGLIKRNLGLKDPNYFFVQLYNTLRSQIESEFVYRCKYELKNTKVYCNYISRELKINETNMHEMVFILSVLPTFSRHDESVNSITQDVRFRNPDIETAFVQLNQIEMIIANAFIRGSSSTETWHEDWLKQLSAGLKEKKKLPYCQDPFNRLRVTSEGDVFFCCFQRKSPIGNLLTNTIDEITNTELAKDIQESVIRGELHKTCQIEACPHAHVERAAFDVNYIYDTNKLRFLDIDPPNTHCNIGGEKPSESNPACIMCERSLPDYRFETDRSEIVLSKLSADKFTNIHIQGVSEPFFQDLIFNYLEKINFKDLPGQTLSTISNAIVFNKAKQERWLSLATHSGIGFSIDASTLETYLKIRRLNTFDVVLKNIKSYSELIKDIP